METKISQVDEFIDVIKFRIVDLENDFIYNRNHNQHRLYYINETSKRLKENQELMLILEDSAKKTYH